jgi:hypothetical protein
MMADDLKYIIGWSSQTGATAPAVATSGQEGDPTAKLNLKHVSDSSSSSSSSSSSDDEADDNTATTSTGPAQQSVAPVATIAVSSQPKKNLPEMEYVAHLRKETVADGMVIIAPSAGVVPDYQIAKAISGGIVFAGTALGRYLLMEHTWLE